MRLAASDRYHAPMHATVLTYHAVNISGNDYASNDLIAFSSDLALITELGLRIVPLAWVVEERLGLATRDLGRCVALSCDDGSDLDYFDVTHPAHGEQRSLFNRMHDFVGAYGDDAQPDLHLTSFVIASPEARGTIDRACLDGRGWMNDDWWTGAVMSGRMAIENHSFDHNHAALDAPGADGMARGSFHAVDNAARAVAEIVAAQEIITRLAAPHRPSLFCYPYGHAPEYLRAEWFPTRGAEHGLRAAFGDGAKPITIASDIWNLPRYVCGWHWKSPDELRAILT